MFKMVFNGNNDLTILPKVHELRWRASKILDLGMSYRDTLASIGKNIGSAFGMPQNYG